MDGGESSLQPADGKSSMEAEQEHEDAEDVYREFSSKTDEIWKKFAVRKAGKKVIEKTHILSSGSAFSHLHLLEFAYPADGHHLEYNDYIAFAHNYYAMLHAKNIEHETLSDSLSTSLLSSGDTTYQEDRAEKRKATMESRAQSYEKVARYLNSLGKNRKKQNLHRKVLMKMIRHQK